MSAKTPESSAVMQKADALIQRHRRTFVAGGDANAGEDLPELTEVIDESALSPQASSDPEFALALERWIASRLPRVVAQALDGVSEQLVSELANRLRRELGSVKSAQDDRPERRRKSR